MGDCACVRRLKVGGGKGFDWWLSLGSASHAGHLGTCSYDLGLQF